MSRFFHGVGSDSETSSSEEEELYSDRDEEEESEEEESSEEESSEEEESSSEEETGRTGASRFMRDVSESEESEDEDRVTVVKSAKDKRLEELESTVKLIENAEKINDWAVISTGEYTLVMLWKDRVFAGSWMILTIFRRVRQVEPANHQDNAVGARAQAIH